MVMAYVIMAMLHDNGLYQSIHTYHDDNYCVYHMQWKHHTINSNKAVIIGNITITLQSTTP